ncbi:uncharacterized protein LOC105692460 isoform X2 [Athalia rosae]|nr:uncharacterized protein LOC105692460 isoform X2 [Athalia rosae]XP_048513449.1 uncharacterized protein LOC105692460 isoform X2 [Athalia rosae]XP_048513450.1 uncharacterized protein LOC105692460 isoform X2 [Athalia rosae]XP_048513451.1 uncharacterized protein LOC105692460 isoform X2 [Athalia rosae]
MRKEEQWRHGAHRIICTSASRHFRNPLQRYLRNHMIPPDRECFADQYRESTSCGGAFLLPLTLLLLLLLLYRNFQLHRVQWCMRRRSSSSQRLQYHRLLKPARSRIPSNRVRLANKSTWKITDGATNKRSA